MLLDKGYIVSAAASGAEGLQLYTDEAFDIVLLDYDMPEMTGEECFKRLKQLNINICAVLISGMTDEAKVHELLELGFASYLPKPFKPSQLYDTVEGIA